MAFSQGGRSAGWRHCVQFHLPFMCPGSQCHSLSPCHSGPRIVFLPGCENQKMGAHWGLGVTLKGRLHGGRITMQERTLDPGPEGLGPSTALTQSCGTSLLQAPFHLHRAKREGGLGDWKSPTSTEVHCPPLARQERKTWNPRLLSPHCLAISGDEEEKGSSSLM